MVAMRGEGAVCTSPVLAMYDRCWYKLISPRCRELRRALIAGVVEILRPFLSGPPPDVAENAAYEVSKLACRSPLSSPTPPLTHTLSLSLSLSLSPSLLARDFIARLGIYLRNLRRASLRCRPSSLPRTCPVKGRSHKHSLKLTGA
jgi:hypothetical protein